MTSGAIGLDGDRAEAAKTIASHLHRASAVFTHVPSEALAHIRSAAALVASVLDEAPAPAPMRGGLAPWQADRLERHIARHLDGRITVEAMAEVTGLSVGHFHRAFKASYGLSPQAHLIERRVHEAKRLMLAGEERLAQISVACGFSDQSHFSNVFRRSTGQSPGAWRKTRKNA
jgi:AraC family transcriptional regulator